MKTYEKTIEPLYNLYLSNSKYLLISSAKIRLFPHTAMDFCHLFLKNALFLIYVKHIYPFET